MENRFLVASQQGLFDIQKQVSGKWEIVARYFLGASVSMVLRDCYTQSIYAALSNGHFGATLHRSDDDGISWQEINTPTYRCDSLYDAPNLQMIGSLEAGKDTLWAGTVPGGLFKSTDRGETWILIQSLWDHLHREDWLGGEYNDPGIHSICIDPRNSSRIAIAASCGGVWLSEDDTESWQAASDGLTAEHLSIGREKNSASQNPLRLTQCRSQRNSFWVQNYNSIARSTDYCKQWEEIKATPSSFGNTVVVHPDNPDTAWFVPVMNNEQRYPVNRKFVVTRTTDGGKTFTSLSSGLPQAESYEIVSRHGLDIDGSGKTLAMGTTTGSLWVSENGGNNWIEVSRTLPPIDAVRFIWIQTLLYLASD